MLTSIAINVNLYRQHFLRDAFIKRQTSVNKKNVNDACETTLPQILINI